METENTLGLAYYCFHNIIVYSCHGDQGFPGPVYYCFHDVTAYDSSIRLVDTVHQLESSSKEALVQCAVWLKRLGQVRDGTIC